MLILQTVAATVWPFLTKPGLNLTIALLAKTKLSRIELFIVILKLMKATWPDSQVVMYLALIWSATKFALHSS